MASSKEKSLNRTSLAIDAGLTLAALAVFTWIARSHVPSDDPKFVWIFGVFTASCMTGVFWMALQMFRVVLRAQRERCRATSPGRNDTR